MSVTNEAAVPAAAPSKAIIVTPLFEDLRKREGYNPNSLFDALIEHFGLKNDAALSRMLEVAPPVVSKARHLRLEVTPALLLRIHDMTDIPVNELRALMGVAPVGPRKAQ